MTDIGRPMPVDLCSCGARIIRAIHATTGRTAPINADPDPDGTIILSRGRAVVYRIARGQAERAQHAGRLHVSHFATCPDAARYRTTRQRRKP